ncbi:MAG: hypothetical protein PUJ59_08000 [Clostridiaceae bacterium]|nr:hypothetical protein [Clostridiaceae bacterium]MDY5889326.1 hypothetical protein [Oscillospiraceae bacterium]
MRGKYDDIINMPHHTSTKHPRMTRTARAAQFAPFAALTGLDDEMEETARLTDKKITLDEEQKQVINRELLFIKNNPQRDIPVIITFFKSDGRKDGGAYIEKEVRIKKIDEINRKLILSDYSEIKIDDLFSVRIKEK